MGNLTEAEQDRLKKALKRLAQQIEDTRDQVTGKALLQRGFSDRIALGVIIANQMAMMTAIYDVIVEMEKFKGELFDDPLPS